MRRSGHCSGRLTEANKIVLFKDLPVFNRLPFQDWRNHHEQMQQHSEGIKETLNETKVGIAAYFIS